MTLLGHASHMTVLKWTCYDAVGPYEVFGIVKVPLVATTVGTFLGPASARLAASCSRWHAYMSEYVHATGPEVGSIGVKGTGCLPVFVAP